MYTTYEQKYQFVQNRVELDHQRRLNSHPGVSALERPGGMFDGGYGVFGNFEAYDDEPGEGPETASPLIASLAALQAMPEAAGVLAPAIAVLQRKLGKAKGGGGKGGGGGTGGK